ncbi:GNAT family N-acetyltransferase [Legionella antarctica]|uniref:GNAT family N-acetyltransferase n=1 Tax=Legionella antarctica TaxID=2708020 RepID=A0A6F8T694_9GAMM|nr:GNAT family N-acetyltransferase [Legionella antarctica]BCA95670.1 GNAT family N-acetyltransferase [Legionella antarctica]
MHLSTSAKPKLTFKSLKQIEDPALSEKCLGLVTTWFTEEWGYIHDKDKTQEHAIKTRKKNLKENADKIHIAFYEKLIVGAFRIEEKKIDENLLIKEQLKTSEIWFIYVDPTYRSLGAGRQMVQEIKRMSKDEMKAGMVLLETLNPGLNHLYMTEGGKVVCENSLDNNPTDVIKIGL